MQQIAFSGEILPMNSFLTGHLFFQNGTECTERQSRNPFRPEAFLAAAVT
jgi:hypothetical protein